MQRTNLIVGILGAALASVTFAALGGILDILNTTQEVYAPSSRRGFMCEFRAAGGAMESWMPYTQQVIESVEAQSGKVAV